MHEEINFIQDDINEKYMLLTDSKSKLTSIENQNRKNMITQRIIEKYQDIMNANKSTDIIFCWIPLEVGIGGKELADGVAK